MKKDGWSARFFSSTRGQIILLLRRAERTVTELAEALGLTDNAVRAHLATLERDGLVRQTGRRRGARKPHFAYSLTSDADQLFPHAYGALFQQLVSVLYERMDDDGVRELLREVGRRVAVAHDDGRPSDDLDARIERAVRVLDELGGLVEVETQEGRPWLRGYSCPLAAAVSRHPEVCRLAEALLSELIGAPVREHCDRRSLRCAFEVMVGEG